MVLAGGTGSRFGAPKQLALVGGRRLVDRAVDTAGMACGDVVLVVPDARRWDGAPVTAVVDGGPTRAGSVRAGLSAVPADADVVVVHDAAHPLATTSLFAAVIAAVRAGALAATPFLPVVEAVVRRVGDEAVAAVPKDGLVLSQTPHAFRADVVRALHADAPEGTDEVSMLLARGTPVALVPGEATNIHVTTTADRAVADRLAAMLGAVAKYDPLFEHLCRAGDGPVELSFDEVGRLVGGLPRSATTSAAWWANEAGGRHVQAQAWLNAGRQVDHVDRAAGRVTFSAAGWRRGS